MIDKHVDATRDSKMFQIVKLIKNGTMIVTASKNGTLLQFVNIDSGELVYKVTRGYESAEISSISFKSVSEINFKDKSPDESQQLSDVWLVACTSFKSQTCHLFAVNLGD